MRLGSRTIYPVHPSHRTFNFVSIVCTKRSVRIHSSSQLVRLVTLSVEIRHTISYLYLSTLVFSWFLPEYVPDSGPALAAQLVSPESLILTMPNAVGMLNGMFSLVKYGLSNCYDGFGTDPAIGRTCLNGNGSFGFYGRYARSFGRLTYVPNGATIEDWVDDLALVLTAGRLSNASRAEIVSSCSRGVNLVGVGDNGNRPDTFPLGVCQVGDFNFN